MADLNALLERHARGEDTTDQFNEFMAKHGDYFPENPSNVDELIDALARRAAAGERLMRSLSAEQQDELAGSWPRQWATARWPRRWRRSATTCARCGPTWPGTAASGCGATSRSATAQATSALEEIGDLDDLMDQLAQDHPGATLDDVDVDSVERNLGRDAADDVRRLQELEKELRQQGWVSGPSESLTLSPKALRRLGGTALRTIFSDLEAGRRGQHDLHDAGAAGEITGASRAWEFGDEQPLDVVRTVSRAVQRSGAGTPVRLQVDDFEVVETERRASAAVALCVDLSFSMILRDCWGPMKQTALALSHLVATRFPQDALQIIGFGLSAAVLTAGRAGRGRARPGEGHQPAVRAAAGRPSPAQALRRRAGRPGSHRR